MCNEHPLRNALLNLPTLIEKKSTVLVGFSGGKDSQALTHLLMESGLGLRIILAHIDHGIRPGSAKDAAKAKELALQWGLEFLIGTVKLGPDCSEEKARITRHQALAHFYNYVKADYIALGHTASDQLETLLMKMNRGSGLKGMCAMREKSGMVVRPLLFCQSEQLRAYCELKKIVPIEDETNATDHYKRNRFRHHLVPFLLKENPQAELVASVLAQNLQQEDTTLSFYEESEYKRIENDGELNCNLMSQIPQGMQARILKRFWAANRKGGRQLNQVHIEKALSVINSPHGGKTILLPGLRLKKKKGVLKVV